MLPVMSSSKSAGTRERTFQNLFCSWTYSPHERARASLSSNVQPSLARRASFELESTPWRETAVQPVVRLTIEISCGHVPRNRSDRRTVAGPRDWRHRRDNQSPQRETAGAVTIHHQAFRPRMPTRRRAADNSNDRAATSRRVTDRGSRATAPTRPTVVRGRSNFAVVAPTPQLDLPVSVRPRRPSVLHR